MIFLFAHAFLPVFKIIQLYFSSIAVAFEGENENNRRPNASQQQ